MPSKKTKKTVARISKIQAKEMFMASEFIEWGPFREKMGWPEHHARGFDVRSWVREKKEKLASAQADRLSQAIFHEKSRWHNDVINTLRDYPQTHDAIHAILKKRVGSIIEMIHRDDQKRNDRDYKPQFPEVKTSELLSLAASMKVITESKHKSLLIDRWSFEISEGYIDAAQVDETAEDASAKGFQAKIIGMGEKALTSGEAQKLLTEWYDKPIDSTLHSDNQND